MNDDSARARPDCACQRVARLNVLDDLAPVRAACPALRALLLPDWDAFVGFNRRKDGPRSFLWRVARAGGLGRLAGAVHAFLLRDETVRDDVRADYAADVAERWTYRASPLDHHVAENRYLGKLSEIVLAGWLAEHDWCIRDLGAWNAPVDVDAVSPNGGLWSIEAKHIGQDGDDFSATRAKRPGSLDDRAAADYLKVRLFDAARQLGAGSLSRRACVFILDRPSWDRFGPLLDGGRVEWNAPVSFTGDRRWNNYLTNMIAVRYPDYRETWAETTSTLNAAWFLLDGMADGGEAFDWKRTLIFPGRAV